MVFPTIIQLYNRPQFLISKIPIQKESRLGEVAYVLAAGTSWARTSNSWNNARPTVSMGFGSLGVDLGAWRIMQD